MFKYSLILATYFLVLSTSYAVDKTPISHTHDGRTHTHVLPSDKGISHKHNQGKQPVTTPPKNNNSVRSVFAGNTAQIYSQSRISKKFHVYFQNSGKMFVSRNGITDLAGQWHVNKNNKLCFYIPDGNYATPDTRCFKLTRNNNNEIYGRYGNENTIIMTSIYRGDTLNMVAKYNSGNQKITTDLRTNWVILGTLVLGAIALDAMSSPAPSYPESPGYRTSKPYSPPSYNSKPDTSVGCAWGDRAYGTCQ